MKCYREPVVGDLMRSKIKDLRCSMKLKTLRNRTQQRSIHHATSHYTTLHHTTPHHTKANYTTLHCTTSHYTTPHHTASHYTTSHYTAPHHITLHRIKLDCTAPQYYSALRFTFYHIQFYSARSNLTPLILRYLRSTSLKFIENKIFYLQIDPLREDNVE